MEILIKILFNLNGRMLLILLYIQRNNKSNYIFRNLKQININIFYKL